MEGISKESTPGVNERLFRRVLERLTTQTHARVLKVVCENEPTSDIMKAMQEAGFQVVEVTVDSPKNQELMTAVDAIIYAQQQYSESRQVPPEIEHFGSKVVLLFHPVAFEECLKDHQFQHNWALNSGYGTTYTL